MEDFGLGGLVGGLAPSPDSPASGLSIRLRQRAALEDMLARGSLQSSVDGDEGATDAWKVLVYDNAGRDIIAPLLRVADLRARGVTLHLSLAAARQPIADVPAVYFVSPTRASVDAIVRDVARGLYESFALHFTARLPRELLEALAEGVASASAARRVVRVFDMYADFLSLEGDLFALNLPGVYPLLNDKGATSAQVEREVERVVDALFCAVVTLGTVPVVRAQRAGPAEMVARMLEARLREHLIARNNAFAEAARDAAAAPARPLLVIVDRGIDLPVMLHHTWTYQALAHDALGLKLNRVTVPLKDETGVPGFGGPGKTRVFDLDKSDAFWAQNAGLPFPMVAEAVEGALQKYKEEVAKLNTSTDAANGFNPAEMDESGTAKKLAAAISNLPELRKRKQTIDLHTNIATALLDQIKDRGLDGFFQVEEELLQRPATFNVERIIALLRNTRGSPNDKLRVFLIYFLCIEKPPPDHIAKCLEELRAAGCSDFRAFEYLKSIKSFTQSMMMPMHAAEASSNATLGAAYGQVLGTLSQVADNVNRLIISEDKARASARVVQTLMDQRGDQSVLDKYLLLDPKSSKSGEVMGIARRPFKEAILFVVGPGNYVEYQNCQDHVCATVRTEGGVKRHVPNGKTLIYGATEMCTSVQFLEQLHALGGPKPVQTGAIPANGGS